MTQTTMQSRKERREEAKELTVSTWHNGQFGVWKWAQLSQKEQLEFEQARRRSAYVQTFGIYA